MKTIYYKYFVAAFALTFFMGYSPIHAQQLSDEDLFDMSIEELMNVEVTLASKKAESSFDSPLSTTVITHEDLQKSGATTIEEAFRLVPGMIVRQETNGNFDVHMRGNDNIPPGNMTFFSENTMTLIMIDNRKVYNYANGGVFWETLPIGLGDIERIEIVRGPSTALYGPNAVSGVINIVTKKAEDKSVGVSANAQYGSNNTGIYDVAVSSSQLDNKLKLRLGANYEKRERSITDYYSYRKGEYSNDLYGYHNDVVYTQANKDKFYPQPALAKERQGINGEVGYEINDKADVAVAAGYQSSYAQSVFMETQSTPLAGRLSDSYYYNVSSNLYGFNLQLSGTNGTHDIYEGSSASKYDFNVFDAVAEYNLTLDKLNLRPGVSYQKAVYTDLPYGGATNIGYLNAENELSSASFSLRGDYAATEKLRLIAALRMDKYNVPDKSYLTYQFVGTYKLNEKNLLRAGFSRANRGAFMTDTYANYSEAGGFVQFKGSKDLDLATMDMIEFGYRVMATKSLSFDVEVFQTKTTDLSAFIADTLNLPTQILFPAQNLSLTSIQTGGTVNVNYVISPKFQIKLWATYVDAQIKDLAVMTASEIEFVTMNPGPEAIVITDTNTKENRANPQTPNFYGGMSLNASPINKLNIFADVYYLGKQTYVHEYDYYAQYYAGDYSNPSLADNGRTDIAAKATVDLKASYQVTKNASVFVNGRNLFNNNTTEFGFADKIGALYLVGLNLKM